LPFVYPLVLYTGSGKYTAPLDLWGLFKDRELAKKVYTEPFQLIDTQKIDDNEMLERPWSGIMEYFLKYVRKGNLQPF